MEENLFTLWQKEQEFLNREKTRRPDLFVRSPMIDTTDVLHRVGIYGLGEGAPLGYLRLWPQDFIVEEVDTDNVVHTIDSEPSPAAARSSEEGFTVYADLVKVGMSTIEAVEELSREFNLDPKFIGTAGIKDRDAITSQQVSFRNIDERTILSLKLPNLFLKQVRRGKGAVARGGLLGNRFTIIVRSPSAIAEDRLRTRVADAEQSGFANFFYLQRFGTPRLITHLLGLLILQGAYEETVKTMLTYQAPRELPFFQEIRHDLETQWGRWEAMLGLVRLFPSSFRQEALLLAHLAQHPHDFLGALKILPQQVTLGAYAYSSYLFNRKLSEFVVARREPPETLPLVLSKDPEDHRLYEDFLAADEVRLPSRAFWDFPFLQMRHREIPTRSRLAIHGWHVFDKIAILNFTLPKGCYATTFLAHVFQLATGLPIIEDIPTEIIDSRAILWQGTLEPTLERFKDVIVSKIEQPQELGGETAGE